MAHGHKEQEDAYVVLAGSGRILLDHETQELRTWDVIRVAPEVVLPGRHRRPRAHAPMAPRANLPFRAPGHADLSGRGGVVVRCSRLRRSVRDATPAPRGCRPARVD